MSQKRADSQVGEQRRLRRGRWVLGLAALSAPLPAAFAAVDADNPLDLYFTDRYSYDDNLFRVPDALLNSDPATLSVQSFKDYINRASVGLQWRVDASRQMFLLNLRLDDVRYARNDVLNYRGGNGDLQWDWKLGSDLSGRVLAKYDRSLASFANYRLFTRDVVDTASYAGELRYGIGSRWALLASGSMAETDHSAPTRQTDKFESETARGGVEYRTPSGSVFAVDYRDTSARFPIADRLPGGLPYRYDETQTGLTAFYSFSVITQITARAAYQKRDYADARLDDFSGPTWNMLVHWAPREKFSLDLKGWHELTAYSDAESDYFISNGGSIAPTWEPTSKIKLTTTFSYEKQDYVGINVSTAPGDASREDSVQSAKLSIEYEPRDFLSFGLGYNWTERESNRQVLINDTIFVPRAYDNSLVSASFKVTL